MSEAKKQLLLSSAWNWILFGVNAAITLCISPFLVKNLGNAQYGFWTIVVSLLGYYGLLDIGFRNALVRFVAKFHAEQDEKSLNDVVNIGVAVFLVAAICTAIASITSAIWAKEFFDIPANLLNDARLTIIIVGLAFSAQFPLNALSGILIGLQRYDISAKVTLAMVIGQSIGYVVALTSGWGLVGVALVNTMSSTTAVAVMAFIGIAMIRGVSVRPSFKPKKLLLEMVRYSSCIFVIGLSSRIMTYTTPFVIGALMGLESVAIYSIPVMMITYATNIVHNFCRVLQPFASAQNAAGAGSQLAETTLWGSRLGLMIYYPMFVFIYVLGSAFITRWLTPAYGNSVITVLPVLSVATIFLIAEMPLENILMGIGQVRVLSITLLAEAAVCMMLIVLLIPKYHLDGIALATSVPLVLSRGVLIPYYASRKIGFRLRRYYTECFAPLTFLMLPLFGATTFFSRIVPTDNYPVLIMFIVSITLVWSVLVAVFTREGRHIIGRAGGIRKLKGSLN